MERVPITKNGYDKLKKELEHLQKVERPQNIKAIEEARAHGDLSENAEFEVSRKVEYQYLHHLAERLLGKNRETRSSFRLLVEKGFTSW